MKKTLIALALAALGQAVPALPVLIQPVEPERVELPAAPAAETFPAGRLTQTVKSLQIGPQSGITKVLGEKRKVLWSRGFDDQKVARLTEEQQRAMLAAAQVPEQQIASLSQQLMQDYAHLPHAQCVALLGALAVHPALGRPERLQIEQWLNRLLSLEKKDTVTRRQALLALALLPEASDATVTTMLRTYESSRNLWETFPISQFVQYHAVELWQRPDGPLIKQRLGSVPSIYTPVMLEEMARQEPPPATPVLGEPH